MTDVRLAKQSLSHIQVYQVWGFFKLLDYSNVYEEANLVHIRIHILMNCVVFVFKDR